MRTLLNDLKNRSRSEQGGRFREYGAVIVEYADGSTQVMKFTSNEKHHILGEDMSLAINEGRHRSGSFFKKIKRIVHIHTHPDLGLDSPEVVRTGRGRKALSPSPPEDYSVMKQLENSLVRLQESKIEVQGIVLPHCITCDDLMILYDSTGWQPSELNPSSVF